MAIELTAMEVVLSGILAFLAGLFGLLGYYRLRSVPKEAREVMDPAYLQRLEYYESQMIELKVRLDALKLGTGAAPPKPASAPPASAKQESGRNGRRFGGTGAGSEERAPKTPEEAPPRHLDLTNHILQLITNKSLTARDIQFATGRTREHTSRQMKKLAEEGFVKRHSGARPYTYSLTDQGRARLAEQGVGV